MESKIFDALVIGGGPAGVTSAIYLKRAGKEVAIIERLIVGGQVNYINKISNYTGFVDIDGFSLAQNFSNQLKNFNIPVFHEEVINVKLDEQIKIVQTKKEEFFAKVVIIASGGAPIELKVKGEKDFIGRGVSYCAECDGHFYKNQVVAVVGSSQKTIDEANFLGDLCEKVYLFSRYDIKNLNLNDLKNRENVLLFEGAIINEICGKQKVENIKYTLGEKQQNIDVNGVFIIAGNRPNTQFLRDSLKLNENGFIICDQYMQASQKGVFACGDVRDSFLKQISTAVGDGAIAGVQACTYLKSK